MGIDLAAPRVHTHPARERGGSAATPPRRRDGLLSVVALRRVFSRWLLAVRADELGQRELTFRGSVDRPTLTDPRLFSVAVPVARTARYGDGVSQFPLSHVRVLTRDEAAAVHGGQLTADPCRSRSGLRLH